jgi:monofunctional biosynthetic peptidoglycan transglycosylase
MTIRRFLARALAAVIALALLYVAAVLILGAAYRVVTPVSTLMLGRWATLRSVDRVPVPLERVATTVPLAVVASEDARFCQHGGVDWNALREVVEDEEGPSRGASTVPMQVAKNLFLWPSRSFVRKAIEIPVALYLDLVWPKRRMMENYLNIAEWGPGLFGIEAAARRYFNKPARELAAREVALLVTALPNPRLRNPTRPSARHRNLANRLLVRMNAASPFAGCLRTDRFSAGISPKIPI